MKIKKTVIDVLNEALSNEFVAISQYFLHARMSKNRGYLALAEYLRKQAMDEMTHAEALIDHILYLGGEPAPKAQAEPQIGQTVPEQLQNDLALEHDAVQMLNAGIAFSRKKGDNGSADLLRKILVDQEEHAGWLQAQLDLIAKLGETHYLAQQLRA